MSTLIPACYNHYKSQLELIHYYLTNYKLYRRLPTFRFLEGCKIVPTNATTYTLVDLERCLTNATGFMPHIGCSSNGYLNEIWYYFHLKGQVRNGAFEGTNSTFKSTCPAGGIKYPPKLETQPDLASSNEDDHWDSADKVWFKEQSIK
jgi:ribonuclease T2